MAAITAGVLGGVSHRSPCVGTLGSQGKCNSRVGAAVHGVRLFSKRVTRAKSRVSTGRARGVVTRGTLDVRRNGSQALVKDGFDDLEMQNGLCVLNQKYSPELIREKVLSSPGEVVNLMGRGVQVGLEFGVYFGKLLLDSALSDDSSEKVKERAGELRGLLTRLGPSYIKAGQVLANRPDVLRADYMNELVILQDDVPAFPNEEAMSIIEQSVGQPIGEIFSSVSEKPVAAASLGQVYRATLRSTGEDVAIKVQRPNIEPVIYRDLFLFRFFAGFINGWAIKQLGTNAQLVLDEFAIKLLEELDYKQEARNQMDFYENYRGDPYVYIPKLFTEYCSNRVLVMEWVNGVRCTDPQGIVEAGIDVEEFIRVGVVGGLRQLLEFGLFHGDPHPGNLFAMRDGRIAYIDFGNVAQLSNRNKQILIDAVVHAVNEDYVGMAGDFINLGFLAPGTEVGPIVPALETIWSDCRDQSMVNFNFRTVTDQFNKLVYRFPIRIPERYALVIRSLLTQEGICMTMDPDFKFLEVAYPYVAKRLLTDDDPILRERLIQVLFQDGVFQWNRLETLLELASEAPSKGRKLDLSDTIVDGAKVMLTDGALRTALLDALTQDNRLHLDEITRLATRLQGTVEPRVVVDSALRQGPAFARSMLLQWSQRVMAS
uniref:Protein kinase domain-containing protein n=1 Tax=Pyramimonas obovata TaxID=1411642 RepID=A0A7S0R3S3_9CHLO|mmetsp:Transcript_25087/g.54574  ORF Transcript_25087/g.54574 Transcript_25087/m.54574 type:complete len:656 (+) Transcript_25087:217-2184(+)